MFSGDILAEIGFEAGALSSLPLISTSLQRGDQATEILENHFNGFEAVETANVVTFLHDTSLKRGANETTKNPRPLDRRLKHRQDQSLCFV